MSPEMQVILLGAALVALIMYGFVNWLFSHWTPGDDDGHDS